MEKGYTVVQVTDLAPGDRIAQVFPVRERGIVRKGERVVKILDVQPETVERWGEKLPVCRVLGIDPDQGDGVVKWLAVPSRRYVVVR